MPRALRPIPSENYSDDLVNLLRILYPEYEGVCTNGSRGYEEKTRTHERSFGLLVINTANRRFRGYHCVIGVYDKQIGERWIACVCQFI